MKKKGFFYSLFSLVFISCYEINPNTMLIIENLFMSTQARCTIQTGAVAAQFIKPIGILDLAITNTYYMFPKIMNLLPCIHKVKKETMESDLLTQTNYIQIIGAKIKFDIGDLLDYLPPDKREMFLSEHFMLASGVVAPESSYILQLKVIPPHLGNELQMIFAQFITQPAKLHSYPGKEILVYVTLEGILQDQSVVHSNEFGFPIQLCWGCLVRYTGSAETCKKPPTGGVFPCLPGQDEGMDCQICNLVAMYKQICSPPE